MPVVTVAVQEALQDILGTTTLSVDQRNYLDELGNRNGLFDVGDLLALYRRQGLAVPPEALQAATRRCLKPRRGPTRPEVRR